jgi:adenine-specific DNA-methyltransferase
VGAQPATLFDDIQPVAAPMPTTRYQGSKRKLLDWLWSIVQTLDFDTVLDAFSGTASVGYMLKSQGKRVTCNDLLHSNHQVAVALVENDRSPLPDHVADRLLTAAPSDRRTFIADTFRDIYFTDDENAWLDRLRHNIVGMEDRFHRATAWYALFQAAIAKRPYNLFHRRNLYMRTADVTRSFGNKRTWDKPFDEHWRHFVRRANAALIDTNKSCTCVCGDAADAAGHFDCVYIDPPYLNRRGVGVDYEQFYHFLEGILDYDAWSERIDWKSKHRRLVPRPTPWTDPRRIHGAFERLFERFATATIVVSYRSDGIPSIEELQSMLARFKRRVDVHERARYQYALSTNRSSAEVVLIGRS